MESWRDNFIRPWGTLSFYLSLGGLSQMEGLEFFTLLGGDNRVFCTRGMDGQNVQYLQNVVFVFEKGLSGQNHSLSDSHHPKDKCCPGKFLIPPTP